MNVEEKKLDDLMNELGEVLVKVQGFLSGTLIINNYMLDITRAEYVDENNRKVRNTELTLQAINKD